MSEDILQAMRVCREGDCAAWKTIMEQGELEIERLRAEVGARKGDPTTRLHNICRALEQDAGESPFSKEEWQRMDAEQVRLTKELKAAAQRAEAAERELGEMKRELHLQGRAAECARELWLSEEQRNNAQGDRLVELQERVARLEEALRPFAHCQLFADVAERNLGPNCCAGCRAADLLARRALAGEGS